MRQHGAFVGEVRKHQVGGVAVMGMQDDEARIGAQPNRRQKIGRRHTLPVVVVTRPCGHAMNVGYGLGLRLVHKAGPVPDLRVFNGAGQVQTPPLQRDDRMKAEVQHRPVAHQVLARWQPVPFRPGVVAGQEPPFPRPALLGPCQFGCRNRRVGLARYLKQTPINAATPYDRNFPSEHSILRRDRDAGYQPTGGPSSSCRSPANGKQYP